jgi:hypothetical protein
VRGAAVCIESEPCSRRRVDGMTADIAFAAGASFHLGWQGRLLGLLVARAPHELQATTRR